jgi:precorrin-3B synthase
VAGNGESATRLGAVPIEHAIETVQRVLEIIARHGKEARARDILADEGVAAFQNAIADLLQANGPHGATDESKARLRRRDEIGLHLLRDGTFACGIGLPFGHADAAALERLADAAAAARAEGIRAGTGRVLMAIAIEQPRVAAFVAAAERLGFIVRPDDARRRVVACPGAPFCGSAHIAARSIAPLIANAAASFLRQTETIHVSGCGKGCAHPAAATLTIVGTPGGCALIADGEAGDHAQTIVPAEALPAAIRKILCSRAPEAACV